MKIIIVILIALAICQSDQDQTKFTQISQKDIQDLQQALGFNKEKTREELKGKDKNFFSSLFSSQNLQKNKNQISKALTEQFASPKAFQSRNNEQSNDQQGQQFTDQMKELLKNIPYEAFLPKRRKASPMKIFGNLLRRNKQQEKQSSDQDSPIKQLDQLLFKRHKRNKGKRVFWENPGFKKGKEQIPFTKIFGSKSKSNRQIEIPQQTVQKLLVQSMPNLKGGKIVKLFSVSYQKGTYLHIEYETAKQQIYMIKAKYLLKTNELQIINLNEIQNFRKSGFNEEKELQDQINEQMQEVKNAPSFQKVDKKEEEAKINQIFEPVEKAQENIKKKSQKTEQKRIENKQDVQQSIEPSKKQIETPIQIKQVKKDVQLSKDTITDKDLSNQKKNDQTVILKQSTVKTIEDKSNQDSQSKKQEDISVRKVDKLLSTGNLKMQDQAKAIESN